MALTKAMAEQAGEAAWCIHLGATSNDIVDTAVALQIRDSIALQKEALAAVIGTLAGLAERERDTVMLGRTHGQAAVPITFGLKVAVFLDEFARHLERLMEIEGRVTAGKFLGAVGTGSRTGRGRPRAAEHHPNEPRADCPSGHDPSRWTRQVHRVGLLDGQHINQRREAAAGDPEPPEVRDSRGLRVVRRREASRLIDDGPQEKPHNGRERLWPRSNSPVDDRAVIRERAAVARA